MKTKLKNLLFEYTRNSRITTKELGKKVKSSQQSASYLLNSLKKRKYIEKEATIVDSVKFGFVSVLVGFSFIKPNKTLKKEVIEELNEIDSIVTIEEGKEGVDLLVEYISSNLSSFNKTHSDIIHKFYKRLRTVFVFPLIVNHEYYNNYLTSKLDSTDNILFGDRILREINENEAKVLTELVKNPTKKLIDISESTDIPIKSVMKIKKSLEKRNIIKGYTAILNYNKLGIHREIIFLRFSSEGIIEIDKFSDYAKYNKKIVKFFKVIGEYNVSIAVESLNEIEILNDIRSNFSIEKYLIIKIDKIHKKTYLPVD